MKSLSVPFLRRLARPPRRQRIKFTPGRGLVTALVIGCSWLASATAQPVKVGAATYFLSPKAGDKGMPAATLRLFALHEAANDPGVVIDAGLLARGAVTRQGRRVRATRTWVLRAPRASKSVAVTMPQRLSGQASQWR